MRVRTAERLLRKHGVQQSREVCDARREVGGGRASVCVREAVLRKDVEESKDSIRMRVLLGGPRPSHTLDLVR